MLLTKLPSMLYVCKKIRVEFLYTLAFALIASSLTYQSELVLPAMPISIPAVL